MPKAVFIYSQSALLQVAYYSHIKFTDVKALDVFSVEVNHVAVGNASVAFNGNEGAFLAPCKRVFAYKSVVCTVKVLNQIVGEVERELAACGFVKL